MKRNLLFFGFGVMALFILVSAINKPMSSGAPSASTGAPSEQTCAMSGCHDDHALNSGKALLSIAVGKFGENSNPGLPLTIKIADVGKIRFGFQVTALDESNNKIGKFVITDSVRTQLLGPKTDLPDRNYLTYTYYGTLGTKLGENEWKMNWIPTENKPGKVTFYVAALSADNDGSDKGDYTYTAKTSTSWETTLKTIIWHKPLDFDFSLSTRALSIQNPENSYLKSIVLSDLKGKLLLEKSLESSGSILNLSIPDLPYGIIIATLKTSDRTFIKKIFSAHD